MCKPSTPKVSVPEPAPTPTPPTQVSAEVREARSSEKRQARLSGGRRGTILTDGLLGEDKANTGGKTLLGQ